MQINEVSSVETQSFVNDFLNKRINSTEAAPAADSTQSEQSVQQFLQTTTKPEETTEGKPEGESSVEQKTVEQVLKEAADAKANEATEAKPLISDVKKFAETLAEKNLLFKYSDGTLPESDEELLDALLQSGEQRGKETLNNLWEQKVNGFSPQVQTILRYAEMGGTTAAELSKMVNQVSQYESVATLDPKNPEHQEQIVLLQLMNAGISEKAAREDIADFKALNKLESKATEYFPSLKKVYETQMNQTYLEKQRAIEEEDRYIQTNATNVDYFLNNEEQYLPFKLNNNNYKAAIFQLAAQPTAYTESGEAIFGWEQHLKGLQTGDEASYKKFMKIMAFAANPDAYEKNLSKSVSNQASTTAFKKIMTTEGKANNTASQQTADTPTIQRQASNKPWSVGR